jgi:hypothetical protein
MRRRCRSASTCPPAVDDGKMTDLQIQTCKQRGCYANTHAGSARCATLGQAAEKLSFQISGEGNDYDPDAARGLYGGLRQDQAAQPSLRANGSRERAPDDKLRETHQAPLRKCFALPILQVDGISGSLPLHRRLPRAAANE